MALQKPLVLLLLATVALSACEKKVGDMMNLRAPTRGPDEFAILPTKPLSMPRDYAALPEPTVGGSNLTDPTPREDAVAALGGSPKRMNAAGIPAGDAGLVSAAGRYGVSSDIRNVLAAEDVEFRKDHRGRILERLLKVTVYFKAYEPQTLDRYAELERMRRAGIRTPAAPPEIADN